jgi:N-acyl-D-amino-acid deacylase
MPARSFMLALLSATLLTSTSALADPAQYDVILRHGTVVDGTGAPGRSADVGVIGGHIAAVGDLKSAKAATEIDASGMVVAPGFINIHSHADPEGLQRAENMLTQGVTTEVINADGSSGVDLNEQFKTFSAGGMAVNIGGYIGFNTAWKEVMGDTNHRATPEDIAKMQKIVVAGLEAGAFGVSAGLDYKPGYYATTEEATAVLKAAAPWRTNFPNHERLTPEAGLSSRAGIGETIKIASDAGVSPEVTHIKAQGKENGKSGEITAMMAKASAAGHYTPGDVYPYLAGMTALHALLTPGWAQEGGFEALQARLKDPAIRAKIVDEIEFLADARLVHGVRSIYLPIQQKQMADVIDEMGVRPGEAVARLLDQGNQRMIATFGAEADLETFLRYPDIAVSCDCGSTTATKTHPRVYGTFPRVLGVYVRDRKVISLEEAVRKMTGLPATITGMTDRGFLAPGMAADVVVFDPKTITDHSTYEQPSLQSEGIRQVLVNGKVALDQGKVAGVQAGVVLRRDRHMPTRPINLKGDRQISGAGQGLSFSVSQAGTAAAKGALKLTDAGGQTLEAKRLGLLQTAPGWASFTAQVAAKNGPERSARVTVDGAEAIVEIDGQAPVTVALSAN